jgi:hypothetical protein
MLSNSSFSFITQVAFDLASFIVVVICLYIHIGMHRKDRNKKHRKKHVEVKKVEKKMSNDENIERVKMSKKL